MFTHRHIYMYRYNYMHFHHFRSLSMLYRKLYSNIKTSYLSPGSNKIRQNSTKWLLQLLSYINYAFRTAFAKHFLKNCEYNRIWCSFLIRPSDEAKAIPHSNVNACIQHLSNCHILKAKRLKYSPDKNREEKKKKTTEKNYFRITWFTDPLAITVFLTFTAKLELMISNQLTIFCWQNTIIAPLPHWKPAQSLEHPIWHTLVF